MDIRPAPPRTRFIEELPTAEGYDRWAALYDAEDNPLIALEEQHFDEWVGPIAGMSVADVGCGTGRHALRLAQRGARVTGFDFSAEMLRQAAAKPGAGQVRFVTHDLTAPLPVADATFDRVITALVVEHLPDLGAFYRELARISRPTGQIIISGMHPDMTARHGVQAHFTDPQTGREIRPRGFPYQMSDYLRPIAAAGLRRVALLEAAVGAQLAARSPRARKYLGVNMLFMLRLERAEAGE